MNPAVSYLPIIICSVLLNAAAQLLLKQGMLQIGHFNLSFTTVLPVAWQVGINPYILLGLSSYVVSVVVWLLVLSRVEVSFAYPMLSIGYIVNTVAAYYLFAENVSFERVVGVLVIILGVYLISKS